MTHSIARIAALTLALMALSATFAVAQSTEKPGDSSAPFHGMQLRDRVIVVDSNVAALNFVFQGEQKGSITGLGRVEADVPGMIRINSFATIGTLSNGAEDSHRRAVLRAAAALFHRNFNDGHLERNAWLARGDVHVNADNTMLRGRSAVIGQYDRLKQAFPDMQIHDEYVLADGYRAAVEYVMEGTQTGPFTSPDGSILQPTGKRVRVRGIDFMAFDETGLLRDLIVVRDEDSFAEQLTQ
jgi:predicted ester cyclase